MAHDSALRAMNEALAAYVPPTPWAEEWVNEVTQVLDSVIAEQFRLQSQVEYLEQLRAGVNVIHPAHAQITRGDQVGAE